MLILISLPFLQELRKISVRERTQHWEAKGSEIPSFFTLPKSFRNKAGSSAGLQSPVSSGSGTVEIFDWVHYICH